MVRRSMGDADFDHGSVAAIIVTLFASLYEHAAGTHLPLDLFIRRRDSGETRRALHGERKTPPSYCVLITGERERVLLLFVRDVWMESLHRCSSLPPYFTFLSLSPLPFLFSLFSIRIWELFVYKMLLDSNGLNQF